MTPSATNGVPAANVSFEDYLVLSGLAFEWADSFDSKDWERLRHILAPTLRVDYTKIGKKKWEAMSADDFIAMASDPDFLGDPCVKTQHLLGATRWERISATEVVGYYQIRAAHQVYTEPDLKTVKLSGHSYATNELYFTHVGGAWKFAGLKPTIWKEHNFEKVFKGSYKH